MIPRHLINIGVDKHVGASHIALHRVVITELGVVDHGRQQVVGEVAALQFADFGKQQVFRLFEALAGTWRAAHDEAGVVAQGLAARPCIQHLHLLVDVQVDEAGGAVAQHLTDDIQSVHLQRVATVEAPAKHQVFGFEAVDGGVLGCGDGSQSGEFRLLHVSARLPAAKILVDDGDDLVGVEVAGHADGHVVRTIPLVEVVLDVNDRRVLQVLLRADGGLRAVGVRREEHGAQGFPNLAAVLGDADVVFFIHGFQFGVEPTDDHVLETVGLDLGPVLDFIRRDVLSVAGHVVGGVGVGAFSADGRHELVVLVGDEILGGQLAHRVDFVIGHAAFLGVGEGAVFLITRLDVVQERLLGGRVGGAELVGALKHQVLKVVSQASGLGGVVLRAGAHGDVGLDARLFVVDAQVDLQAVVERVDAGFAEVALHGLKFVLAFLLLLVASGKKHQHRCSKQQCLFRKVFVQMLHF